MHDHNHQCACGHHQGEGGCCHDHQHQRGESNIGSEPEIASDALAMTNGEKHECACGGHCGCCEEEHSSP